MQNEEPPSSGYNIQNDPSNPNIFVFETVSSLIYEVRFKPSGYIFANDPELDPFVFEMSIALIDNPTGKRPGLDPLLPPTIVRIFSVFFQQHERIVLYICDTSDQRAAARQRKFSGWFDLYQDGSYVQFSDRLIDDSGEVYYISLVIHRMNPYRRRLVTAFNDLLMLSQDDK